MTSALTLMVISGVLSATSAEPEAVPARASAPFELRARLGAYSILSPLILQVAPEVTAAALVASGSGEVSLSVHGGGLENENRPGAKWRSSGRLGLNVEAGPNFRHDWRSADGEGPTLDLKALFGVEVFWPGGFLPTAAFAAEPTYWVCPCAAVSLSLGVGLMVPIFPFVRANLGFAWSPA